MNAEASSSKHSKRDKKERKERKEKKRSKHASSSAEGPFEHRLQRMRLSIPPKFSADWSEGVREVLNGMLMQYVAPMGGVLLAHWEHELVDDTVRLMNECPFGIAEIQFESIVWAPRIGQVLSGTHSLSSPSHLSLLFAKTFNVSIPLNHIPLDTYEFEHTDENPEEEDMESDDEVDDVLLSPHEVGRWKNKESGEVLGTDRVKFTVTGLTVTNNMLSLVGSLLADPASAPPMPTMVVPRSPSPDIIERPAKAAKVATPKAAKPVKPVQKTAATPVVDESKMSARELKAYRKEQARAKRDARKARKADGDDDGDDGDDGEEETAAGTKRKAEAEEIGERKKKRTD